MTSHAEHNPFVAPQAALEDAQTLADSQFTLNLFSPAGRIGRVRYLGYTMALSFLIMLVAGIVGALTTPILIGLGYVAMLYAQFMLAIKRSHDFNTTGWASLLILIPLVNLLFLFVPGTDGPNRFGNKTAPNGRSGLIVIGLVLGIALIGIVAAIAIPAYQQYSQRAQAAAGR